MLTGTKVAVKGICQQGFSRCFQEVQCLKGLHYLPVIMLFEVTDTWDKYFLFMKDLSEDTCLTTQGSTAAGQRRKPELCSGN